MYTTKNWHRRTYFNKKYFKRELMVKFLDFIVVGIIHSGECNMIFNRNSFSLVLRFTFITKTHVCVIVVSFQRVPDLCVVNTL